MLSGLETLALPVSRANGSMLTDDTSRHLAVCDSVPAPGYRAAWEAPRRANASSPPSPKRGAEGAAPAGGTACPPVPKNVGGWSGRDSGAGQARPSAEGGSGHNKTIRPGYAPPLAKYERLCYSAPMKWAAGPLLSLGACHIHIALEANHRESPCGRSAEGTTQGARPSEEGWDRSECRCKAQALWSHPTP